VNNALTANTISSPAITTNAMTVNNIINSNGGVNMSGTINLCGASDYSKGAVGIGGSVAPNTMLTITNTQTTGYGLYLNAPYMSGSWWALSVHGPCINTSGSWSKFSDANLKEKVKPYKDGLAKVLKINPIKFHYTKDSGLGSKKEYVGVSAQDLEEVAPYMVNKSRLSPDKEEEYLSMDDSAMTYMLINAVKELKAELDALKAEVAKKDKKK
jgi:hypothetical protein